MPPLLPIGVEEEWTALPVPLIAEGDWTLLERLVPLLVATEEAVLTVDADISWRTE